MRYQVLPDNKLLGPRFGASFPKVRLALQSADPNAVAASVQAGLPVSLEVDGQTVELPPQEILVQTHPAEGLAVAADKLVTVAVDATLTPELRLEGLAREVGAPHPGHAQGCRFRHLRPHHHLLPGFR